MKKQKKGWQPLWAREGEFIRGGRLAEFWSQVDRDEKTPTVKGKGDTRPQDIDQRKIQFTTTSASWAEAGKQSTKVVNNKVDTHR